MNPSTANSITRMVVPVRAETPKAQSVAGILQQAGIGICELGSFLLNAANKMVFLGFTYAAVLIAVTFLRHMNRLLRTSFVD